MKLLSFIPSLTSSKRREREGQRMLMQRPYAHQMQQQYMQQQRLQQPPSSMSPQMSHSIPPSATMPSPTMSMGMSSSSSSVPTQLSTNHL